MPTRMKGTFIMGQDGGGFSESLYAVTDTGMTYTQMMTFMQQLLPFRMALTLPGGIQSVPIFKTINGVEAMYIRVEDELRNKDALLEKVTGTFTGFPVPTPSPGPIFQQCLNNDIAAKVQWNGSVAGQQAVTYLHGIPVAASDDDINDASAISTLRKTPMASTWLLNLRQYAHAIRIRGLGFRYLTSPWSVGGGAGFDATPTSIAYDSVNEMYLVTMPQAPPQSRMRYVLRGFRGLPFLNGRWAGQQIGTTAVIRIQRRAREVVWDGQGSVAPEVWSYFLPNETIPADPVNLPGAKYFFLTRKKVGRPFGEPRGRVRVRPT